MDRCKMNKVDWVIGSLLICAIALAMYPYFNPAIKPEPVGIKWNTNNLTLAAQYNIISPWPGGNHLVIPNNTILHIGNAAATFRVINGTIVIEGAKIK